MTTAAIIYAAALLQLVIFVATSWALAVAVGARVTEISFGGSPALLTRTVRGVKLRLGVFPSGSIDFFGRGSADTTGDHADDPRSWRRLGLARRLVVIVGPWLATFAVAALCLGPARMLTSAWHGVHQIFLVLDPTPLVRAFVRLAEVSPFAIVLGIVCAKSAAANLAPLPSTAGGGALFEIARTFRPNRELPSAWMIAGLLVMLFVLARFTYAFVRVLVA